MPDKHAFKYDNQIPKISEEEVKRRLQFITPCIEQERTIFEMTQYGDPIK